MIAAEVLRNNAVEMNGERSRLGCSSARSRAEHRCDRTLHRIADDFSWFAGKQVDVFLNAEIQTTMAR